MRRMQATALALSITTFGLAGCWHTEPSLKPPPQPEAFALPPDDPRFSQPIEYPKGTLNQDLVPKRSSTNPKEPDSRFGAGGIGQPGGG